MSKANKSNKAIKYRLYPNDEQKVMFAKTFGCCRFVYNQLLALQKQRYKDGESHLSKLKSNEFATRTLKKDYDAVFIGMGANVPVKMNIEGEELDVLVGSKSLKGEEKHETDRIKRNYYTNFNTNERR